MPKLPQDCPARIIGAEARKLVHYIFPSEHWEYRDEMIYYLPIQDYFIANPALFDQLEQNERKMSVHIPCDNLVFDNDFELQQIAKSTYIGGPSRNLRKVDQM